jgi:type IV pilus assembly protein PilW
VTARRTQRGLGLVELMVGIVISLIVMAGTVVVFLGNSESSIFQMRSTRFIQQMRDTMDRMVQDIRRAGYLGYRYVVAAEVPPDGNPFSRRYSNTLNTEVSVHGCNDGEPFCGLTYAYNLDDDGAGPDGRPMVDVGGGAACDTAFFKSDATRQPELLGFRLNRAAGSIEMRAASDCTTPGADANWVRITDPSIEVVEFGSGAANRTFVLGDRCVGLVDNTGDGERFQDNDGDGDVDCDDVASAGLDAGDVVVLARQVTLNLAARSRRDPAMTFRLSQVVDLPNVELRRVVSP